MPVSLSKILQSQGFGSRRECAIQIKYGYVQVDGQTIRDPKKQFDTDSLFFCVDGIEYEFKSQLYLALNKPVGYECSRQPQHHDSVFDLLPDQFMQRGVQPVGRLDADTSGLILFSDDGQFIHRLTHPKKHVYKHYLVTTNEPIEADHIAQLLDQVQLRGENQPVRADHCTQISSNQIRLVIHQGIYHQVKRMLAAVGLKVVKLHREQIGDYAMNNLKLGEWLYLDHNELSLFSNPCKL